ncbi:hypothetical protein QYE76_054756 [Lolium multiflorum]|uniref:Uncharacterized protein n=1 Tax=Lolium multiflorum TaxID=4521 RepID=A0AAD8SYK1_LOLMU|nr:hypothetical protein QYE76_054756 [Lolium multiflorum]
MPPRKLTKHSATATKMATEDLGNLEWERSKISQQDVNLLKKLGISGKQDALRFPKEESYPAPPMQYRVSFVDHLICGLSTPIHDFLRGLLFMYGLQLHHLTPNSILHIAIFITLCESFLGVQPNWSLWKRIFFCRRNGSSSVAYNIGGVVICVRPDVEYFDVKFPDSVQGWRKKWLYIREENHGSVEDNIPPFDGAEKICRRRSWDAEATDAEKAATEALMTRIHELQNTRGQELSGIQITAYFLRIRVQPLQARKNPLWMYAGDKDVDRLSVDLSVNDLAKLVRKISSLNKKDSVPTSCGVAPYSATNALPQGTSRPESEAAGSRKSAASSEKDAEAEATSSTRSPPSAASPRSKRKRDDAVDTGTSKAGAAHAEEIVPDAKKEALDLYEAALVSSGDEEEDAPIDETARTSTSRTLVVSEARPDGDETSPPQQNPEHPTPAKSNLQENPRNLCERKRTPDEAEELLAKISKNHDDWSTPEPTPTPILKKRGMIELNDEDMREAKKSLMEKGIKSEDVKNLPPIEDLCKIIPPSSTIEDPLYPEGHPKRIEQDSQRTKEISSPSKKKKKKHKTVVESSEPVNDPNSISISDAETESGNEHDEDNDKNDIPDKEEIEKEPEKHDKNKKYTKEDFITKKHGNEREPWVQKPMPFPAKKLKSKEEEHYNKFCDWMKPLFLQIPLTDAIKLPPYSKYMKDIVSNKSKIPNEEISTMLANYSFNGKVPKKLGDPGIPTIPCSIKNNYVRTALCDLGAGVSVMPFSLYKRLDLDKLIPTDISLQMADKSAIPVGVCENVPVQVTQYCLILTDFVVLEIPEDDNMSIILGRPFLNTAGAVIDCNKGKVTFNVDDKEHTVYFPKRIDKVYGVNTIFNVKTIKVGSIDCPIYEPKEEYQTLVIGSISIQYKKRKMNNYNFGEVFEGETTSTGRPSRASTRIRRSYNEDVIAPSFDEGNGDPNASSFPCYEFLSNAGLLDDFLTLVRKAGLTAYMEDERKQYYMLTKIFVESFKFNNKHFNPTVAFKIYGNPVTMKLKDFCAALDIAPAGTAKKIEDNPRVLLELYREITNDDCRTIQRGKIRNIQLPAIKYFAYYLATSILGRENTSNISSYHLAFLIVALTGETPYHLGSVIARRLSNKGPIYGGIIASRILARLDLPLDPTDVEIPPVRLDIAAMKSHQFVTVDSSMDNIVYRMLFADGDEREVLLPQTDLFSIGRKPWSRSKEEVDEQLKIQGFHQQHDSEDAEPSYDYTVTYHVASSSTYLEPGRSSSYYGDTTSWGPWE